MKESLLDKTEQDAQTTELLEQRAESGTEQVAESVAKQSAESPSSSETVSEELPSLLEEPRPVPQKRARRRRKAPFIITGIVLLLVGGLLWWLLSNKEEAPTEEVITDMVMRGSITSMIEGNGQAKPKSSESISVGTTGTVSEVYVTEGQTVEAGTVLYRIDSPGADEAVTKAKKEVESYQKQLKPLYESRKNLTIKPEFSGKLLETEKIKVGDTVSPDKLLARLVDDNIMKLTQYYSYAYENDIYVGMPAQVSIPGVMQQLTGSVTEINKVERVAAEGARLFSIVVSVDNPGSLTEKMPASAALQLGEEEISPYEQGALEYNRVAELKCKVAGEVLKTGFKDYLKVAEGEVLLVVDGEELENQIFQMEESLRGAQETLETTIKNKQKLQGVAPISGTVVGLSLTPGAEVSAGTSAVSIMDNAQVIIEAAIDERNVSYIQSGMMAEIDQWGTIVTGTVESVSLNGKFENGMTTFPAKILVDNTDGMLNVNGGIIYRIQASQSEDCLILPSQCVKSVADPETGEAVSVVFVKSEQEPEGSIVVDGASLGIPATGYFAVPVQVGIADKFNVEIISGVEEGTEVFSQVVKQNGPGGMMYG